jgi:hypothetical protein
LKEYHLPNKQKVKKRGKKKRETDEERQPFLGTDVLKDPAASNLRVQVAIQSICEVLMFSLFAVH